MRRDKNQTNERSISYRKQVVQPKTTTVIKQGFFNFSTNISYRLTGGFNKFRDFIKSDSNHVICIHGKKFQNKTEALAYISKIIWFSYRRLPGLSRQFHSDTGWGCLIRVGQMALAAGLKAYFQSVSGTKAEKQKHLISQKIIVSFVENGGQYEKYSLRNIVQRAHKKYSLNYGQWFNTSQICQVLSYLHTTNPMKGAQNLVIVFFKDSCIYLEQIYTKMNKPMCMCKKKRVQCPTCHFFEQKQIKQERPHIQSIHTSNIAVLDTSVSMYEPKTKNLNQNQLSKSYGATSTLKKLVSEKRILLFLGCRLGCDHVEASAYSQLIQLLSMECSLGIIGGIPRKGYYFTGYQNDQLIYLDPHLVQDQVTLQKLQQLIRTFECKQMRKVKREEIDPSMAFVFYIDSLQTLSKLYNKIQQIKEKYNNPMFSVAWENQFKNDSNGRCSNVQEMEEYGSNQLQNSFIQELQ